MYSPPPFEKSLIKSHRFCVLPPLKNHPSKAIGFVYSPLWKIIHQSPSVLCTPPFEKSPIKAHRFCVLPPLKNHPSKPIGFVYSPLWKITHHNPSVLCTPPFEKSLFLMGAYFGVGVYFGKNGTLCPCKNEDVLWRFLSMKASPGCITRIHCSQRRRSAVTNGYRRYSKHCTNFSIFRVETNDTTGPCSKIPRSSLKKWKFLVTFLQYPAKVIPLCPTYRRPVSLAPRCVSRVFTQILKQIVKVLTHKTTLLVKVMSHGT